MKIKSIILLLTLFLGGCSAVPLALTAAAGTKNLVDDTKQDTAIDKLTERTRVLEEALKFYLTNMAVQCNQQSRQGVYIPSIFQECK